MRRQVLDSLRSEQARAHSARENQTKYTFWTIHSVDGSLPSQEDIYAWNEYLELWCAQWATRVGWQWEEGAHGTPHIQLTLETKKRMRPRSLLSADPFDPINTPWMAPPHVEACHDPAKAFAYCGKEEGRLFGPFFYGPPFVSAQGTRTDLLSFIEDLRTSGLETAIEQHPAVFARYASGLTRLADHFAPVSLLYTRKSYLLYGPPGCGKSYWARKLTLVNHELPPIWISPIDEQSGWFPDIPRQRPYRAVFDDFDGRRSGISLRKFLRLTDTYAIRVPYKGGYTWWQPSETVYTTNFKPQDWYDWRDRLEQWPALVRRFDVVIFWHSTNHNDFDVFYRGTPAFDAFMVTPLLGGLAPLPQPQPRAPAIAGTLDVENPNDSIEEIEIYSQ